MKDYEMLSSFKTHLLCWWYSLALLVKRKFRASHYGNFPEIDKIKPSPPLEGGIKGRGNNDWMTSFYLSPPSSPS